MATYRLHPPYLDETLPAQSGTELIIPFRFNVTMAASADAKIIARIKTVSTSQWLGTLGIADDSSFTSYVTLNPNTSIHHVTFPDFGTINFKPGQFYKIQLACVDELGNIGYYSSVGIFKYTTVPTLSIEEISNLYTYMGVYSQEEGDSTEKLYSYQFDIYHNNNGVKGDLIASSGVQIHNHSNDVEVDKSYDEWTIGRLLDLNSYILSYTVTTINNLTPEPVEQIITKTATSGNLLSNYNLNIKNNYDNGFIELGLSYDDGTDTVIDKINIRLSRSSSEDNFTTWYVIKELPVAEISKQSIIFFKDFSVQQGVKYQYAIQLIADDTTLSEHLMSTAIIADFEDVFLYDGERQLKIKFNPKITNFKTTLLETKTNTIGSKYPFIFKNGNVAYKEFSISGLVSYYMDNEEFFISKNNIGFTDVDPGREMTESQQIVFGYSPYSTQLDSQNIFMERQFKIEVLNWLNNGKVKLFKSPTEGNYIIRLMNTNLAPNDTLGRMLHTFTSQASELMDCSLENLIKLHFI